MRNLLAVVFPSRHACFRRLCRHAS
jgi:hypothetical protein